MSKCGPICPVATVITGKRVILDRAEGTSSYSDHHAKYHPMVRSFLKKFGYYDIFLVDIDSGDTVYLVFKELDFTTSLIRWPLR